MSIVMRGLVLIRLDSLADLDRCPRFCLFFFFKAGQVLSAEVVWSLQLCLGHILCIVWVDEVSLKLSTVTVDRRQEERMNPAQARILILTKQQANSHVIIDYF